MSDLYHWDIFDLSCAQVFGIIGLGLAVGLTSAGGQGGGALSIFFNK